MVSAASQRTPLRSTLTHRPLMKTRALSILTLTLAFAALPLVAETRQRYTITTTAAAPHSRAMRMVTNAGENATEGSRPLRLRTFANINGFAADLTVAEVAELRAGKGVISVDPVVERWASEISGVVEPALSRLESYERQVTPWGLPVIRTAGVWPVTRGEGVNVVVLDTGIDFQHPDLKAAYAGGYNIYDPTKLPIDDNFHGTHVAGTIAATDNAFGTVGASPNVKLWVVKALDSTGKSYDENIAAGIDWAVSKQRELGGRWVVNMSLGAAAEGGNLERAAVERALDAGLVLIAAAGNRGTDFLDFPAQYAGVIPVGAIGQDGRRADFSSYGHRMEIVGPGVAVQSTFLDGYHEEADVVIGADSYTAIGVIGSPKLSVRGKVIDCKLGNLEDFPASVRGNIALIRRGTIDFRAKSRNAKEAGAAAVVIWDHVPDSELKLWTMWPRGCPSEPECGAEWRNYAFPLTIGINYADGQKLLQRLGTDASANFVFAAYGRLSGTSMATPHVSSAAALLLSLNPALKPVDIAFVLKHTARDTADQGWDYETGHGVIDVLAAAQFVAPQRFGLPPNEYTPPRRRGVRP